LIKGKREGTISVRKRVGEQEVPGKTIAELITAVNRTAQLRGRPEVKVKGMSYDSRRVRPGDLFVAMKGMHVDGHLFVEQAIERGAAAVLHEDSLPSYRAPIAYLQVPDARRAMSVLAPILYGHPSRELTTIGVTGTDGKSTTVWLIHQLLEALGRSSGFLSTVRRKIGSRVEKNPLRQSTPEAPDIQALLRQLVRTGKSYAVLEATSHGLSGRTGRLAGVEFDVAVCTNISHEHLEFHGSLEQYRSDKANLFRALTADAGVKRFERFGVLNLDDPSHEYLACQTASPLFRYSLGNSQADLFATDIRTGSTGSTFTLEYRGRRRPVKLNLVGTVNIENLLAAGLTVLRLLSLSLDELAPLLPTLKGLPGRMQAVSAGQPFRVIVDYAHTPRAFSRLFPLVRSYTRGRLIVLFGSAGERDLEKRPLQGEIASRYCDIVILADEDPRTEDPAAILEEIAAGCRRENPARKTGRELFLIQDRRAAMRRAFTLARKEDTVLLLGKGHEDSILYSDGPLPWDEAGIARELLGELGYRR
jgi:UDP-N-acetylmuramoyl-L-alanyl-D-glutamate--2,6-diaminopimelate ligase